MNRIFAFSLLIFGALLFNTDKLFFKANQSFSIRSLFSIFKDTPSYSSLHREKEVKKFTYLGKGHQSFVFESEDKSHVLKFYHFPSHLRPCPWLKLREHPKKKYNIEKFKSSLESYAIALKHLKEESALKEMPDEEVLLIDKGNQKYLVPLGSTFFLYQEKAERIFPKLQTVINDKNPLLAKELISSIFDLIVKRSQKGILDLDPVLEKNYGFINNKAMHIDVGRFKKAKNINIKEEVTKLTVSLKEFLEENSPELLLYYEKKINLL